jgi:hypothetical protein
MKRKQAGTSNKQQGKRAPGIWDSAIRLFWSFGCWHNKREGVSVEGIANERYKVNRINAPLEVVGPPRNKWLVKVAVQFKATAAAAAEPPIIDVDRSTNRRSVVVCEDNQIHLPLVLRKLNGENRDGARGNKRGDQTKNSENGFHASGMFARIVPRLISGTCAVLMLLCVSRSDAFTVDGANKIAATDGTFADASNAVVFVTQTNQAGWAVTVPDGRWTWTETLSIGVSNTFTLRGSNAATRPTLVLTNQAYGIFAATGNSNTVVFRDLIIEGLMPAVSGGTAAVGVEGVGWRVFGFSNVMFTNIACNSATTISSRNSTTNAGPFGSFKNCQFMSSGGSFLGSFIRQNGTGLAFNRSYSYGSEDGVFFEDCVANAVTPVAGRAMADGDCGMILIVRRSALTNYTIVGHGPDSGGPTNSTRYIEYAHNQFYVDDFANGLDYVLYSRGGEFRAYSNTVSQIGGHGNLLNAFAKITLDCALAAWASEGCTRQLLYPDDYPATQQPGLPQMSRTWGNSIPGFVFGEFGANPTDFIVAGREYTNAAPSEAHVELAYPHPMWAEQGAGDAPAASPRRLRVKLRRQ